MIAPSVYIFIFIELLFVSWGDFKTKKIPNLWSYINIFFFIILLFLLKDQYVFELKTFVYPFIWLVAGFALFYLNIMGGGDSKFLSTLFLLIPHRLQDDAFYFLIISTIFIGSTVFMFNIIKNWKKVIVSLKERNNLKLKECFGTKFTFAPVILVSWIMLGWYIKLF